LAPGRLNGGRQARYMCHSDVAAGLFGLGE
jgi:hypothetical protein